MRNSKDLPVVISNLTKAKNFISNPRHWAKDEYLDCDFTGFDHRACALGALDWIRGKSNANEQEDEHPSDELCYLNEALWNLYRDQYGSVIEFNDAEETTHTQVMDLFDVAIGNAKRDLRFVNAAMARPAETMAFTCIDATMTFPEAKARVVKTLDRLGITVTEEIDS